MTTRKAIDLQPGDVLVGPGVFVDQGVVKSTVVVDNGVQVNFLGGTHVVRPEDYIFNIGGGSIDVERRRGARQTDDN